MINELPGESPPELVIGVDFGMTQTGQWWYHDIYSRNVTFNS